MKMSHALIYGDVAEGKPFPLGAECMPDGVNFSVYSKDATSVELLLFDRIDREHPLQSITLGSSTHQTYYYWHVFVPGLKAGRFMATVWLVLPRRKEVFVSTQAKCFLTRTEKVLLCRRTTVGARPAGRERTLPQP